MANTTATSPLSMKLLIDPNAQPPRVLLAEASKEVVDFLFSHLKLPVSVVGKHAMVGCVGNLYASVSHLFPEPVKPPVQQTTRNFYRCATGGCINFVTDVNGMPCPNCRCMMTTAVNYVSPPAGANVPVHLLQQMAQMQQMEARRSFVQGVTAYTVLDDLTVTPMSAISSINLLNTFAVRDLGGLQEKNVQLGRNEGMAILKASLQSKTALTDVFLAGDGRA